MMIRQTQEVENSEGKRCFSQICKKSVPTALQTTEGSLRTSPGRMSCRHPWRRNTHKTHSGTTSGNPRKTFWGPFGTRGFRKSEFDLFELKSKRINAIIQKQGTCLLQPSYIYIYIYYILWKELLIEELLRTTPAHPPRPGHVNSWAFEVCSRGAAKEQAPQLVGDQVPGANMARRRWVRERGQQ